MSLCRAAEGRGVQRRGARLFVRRKLSARGVYTHKTSFNNRALLLCIHFQSNYEASRVGVRHRLVHTQRVGVSGHAPRPRVSGTRRSPELRAPFGSRGVRQRRLNAPTGPRHGSQAQGGPAAREQGSVRARRGEGRHCPGSHCG